MTDCNGMGAKGDYSHWREGWTEPVCRSRQHPWMRHSRQQHDEGSSSSPCSLLLAVSRGKNTLMAVTLPWRETHRALLQHMSGAVRSPRGGGLHSPWLLPQRGPGSRRTGGGGPSPRVRTFPQLELGASVQAFLINMWTLRPVKGEFKTKGGEGRGTVTKSVLMFPPSLHPLNWNDKFFFAVC